MLDVMALGSMPNEEQLRTIAAVTHAADIHLDSPLAGLRARDDLPEIPPAKRGGGRRTVNMREVVIRLDIVTLSDNVLRAARSVDATRTSQSSFLPTPVRQNL
jgi:hypothetical protein